MVKLPLDPEPLIGRLVHMPADSIPGNRMDFLQRLYKECIDLLRIFVPISGQ